MYSIRLIKKEVTEVDKKNNKIIDEYASATHIKISNNNLLLYDPVTNNFDAKESEDEKYQLSEYTHIIINHYCIYSIDELKEAYEQLIHAYAMLNLTSAYHREFDNIVSIFELHETLFSIKEKKIIDSIKGNKFEKKPPKNAKKKTDNKVSKNTSEESYKTSYNDENDQEENSDINEEDNE